MTTISEVRRVIEAAAREEEAKITIHDAIRRVLSSPRWAGKKITRAIAKQIRAELGYSGYSDGPVISVGPEYLHSETYSVSIWGKESPYNDGPSWALPLVGDAVEFDARNAWSGDAAKRRQAKRAAVTDSEIADLCDAGDRYRAALADLEKILEFDGAFDPDRYTLEELVKGDESWPSTS